MLDRNDLLPEEQAHPNIVEKLRTAYKIKPEEEQVLIRVHERLAQRFHTLPPVEPVQAGQYAGKQHLSSSLDSSSSSVRASRRWLRHFNTLAAAIIVALLVGSLAFAFVMTGRTKVGSPPGTTNDIRVVLAAEKGQQPTLAAMEATTTLLLQRFHALGLEGAQVHVMTAHGRPEILAVLPHFGGDEQRIIAMLVESGSLAFWGTGSVPVPLGATFNPAQFLSENPGGKPAFTNKDLDLSALAIIHDQAGRPEVSCIMQGNAIRAFQAYTNSNIGNYLTVTLDGKVIVSAVIQSAIAGPFALPSDFTEQQAKAFIAVLSHGPLPVELQRLS